MIFSESRIALLIANSDYEHFSSLKEPVPEARALSKTLKSLGFDVVLIENGSREDIINAIDNVVTRVNNSGGIVFFHYGGHGVQVDGKNYMIPSNARIPDERKVTTRAVNIDEVMTTLDYCGSDSNIVILDACRNNPLPTTSGRSLDRGLTVVSRKPKNSIIVFSAEAGTVAMDGLYTPALTKALSTPNVSFTDVLLEVRKEVYTKSNSKQIPGEYSQLFEKIFLNGDPISTTLVKNEEEIKAIELAKNHDISDLSNFKENGLEIPFGGKWLVNSDMSNGGKSIANIDRSMLARNILRMDYKLKTNNLGYKYAVVYADLNTTTDYSAYSKIIVKVRGTNQNFHLELKTQGVKDYGYHLSEKLVATKEWETYMIPLKSFKQDKWPKKVILNLKEVTGVQVMVNSGIINKVDFIEIEYIKFIK